MQTREAQLDAIKQKFQNTANSITNLYKLSQQDDKIYYLRGQLDLLTEIIHFVQHTFFKLDQLHQFFHEKQL